MAPSHRPSVPVAPVLPALDGVVVTAAGVEAFDCPVCEAPRDLVLPQLDGPADPDQPDRACAECGFAVVVGGARRVPLEHHGSRKAG